MDYEELCQPTVDPEVRAHIYSLVSALGGTGADESGRYILGDEALACLKDLKKWLKLYDEKLNRLDVARCLADANLVKGDLLEILASWPESGKEHRLRSKIALACIELLVPLTWPLEKEETQMSVNYHRHRPFLLQTQTMYKQAVLDHESSRVLRAAVRTGLPSIALSIGERVPRDEGIIKLLLYFFRNIVLTSQPQKHTAEEGDGLGSRSTIIEAFHNQDVLALLLTVSSNIGEDFNTQDTVLLEVLFHMLKGIDAHSLFMDREQLSNRNNDELKGLLSKEAHMHREYSRKAPSRHNRFGTMIWVQRDGDGRHSTVSGQNALKNSRETLARMDASKKWNKPRTGGRRTNDPEMDRFDIPIQLTESARVHLRSFVEEFLDSSFNPLFNNVRRAIEREADRVLEVHHQQCFYLVSWFLEAERMRRQYQKEKKNEKMNSRLEESFEPDSFGLVATVLIQEFFVLLSRYMQNALEMKLWRELQAAMRCFTQILLIVQEMSESPLEEDQEIAENIQNRIFYEETTQDQIVLALKKAPDQGFGYLDAATELAHTFLRMLERYSKENLDLQVRSRRRKRKAKKAERKEAEGVDENEDEEDSETEDVQEAERISRERKFDFARFAGRFAAQGCVDAFVNFTKYYNELSDEQLKRAHRFFYRVSFKQDMCVLLFRLDFLALFNRMIKGPQGLDSKSPMFKEWEELVRQIIKKLAKKLDQRPSLFVELLFSKIPGSIFFLEHGYEKQTSHAAPRQAAVLEVRGSLPLEDQIAVAVGALCKEDHQGYVEWMIKKLQESTDERKSWEAESLACRSIVQSQPPATGEGEAQAGTGDENVPTPAEAPSITLNSPNEAIRMAMIKDGKLRLLMTLCGFQHVEDSATSESSWTIPPTVDSEKLHSSMQLLEQKLANPILEYLEKEDEEGVAVEDMLRRKPTERPRVEYDDDTDGFVTQDEEDFLFPAGGPSNAENSKEAALDKLKKKRRKRNVSELDDTTRDARKQARAEAELARRRAIKSNLYVHDSDEESNDELDREFFAREESRRGGQREKIMETLRAGEGTAKSDKDSSNKRKKEDGLPDSRSKRRKSSSDIDLSDDEAPEHSDIDASQSHAFTSPHRAALSLSSGTDTGEDDTPLSSPPHNGAAKSPAPVSNAPKSIFSDGKINEPTTSGSDAKGAVVAEEPDTSQAGPGRRRVKMTIFNDSDDE